MFRLYELERDKGTKIFLVGRSALIDKSEYIIFGHIDGMYSYCTTEKGAVVHLSATTLLKKVDDGYEISLED